MTRPDMLVPAPEDLLSLILEEAEANQAVWHKLEQSLEIPDKRLKSLFLPVLALVCETFAFVAPLSLMLSSDEHIRQLNRDFRGQDKATNILSFPASDTLDPRDQTYLGDLILASGTVEREAKDMGKPLADHLRHLFLHGLLHLLGYDHEEDVEAEEMEALEIELLAKLCVPNPYA